MSRNVVMLLSNPYRPDPRVVREAHSLVEAGFSVTVVCWDRKGEYAPSEQRDGVSIRRIGIRSRYSLGSRQLWRIGLFWGMALKEMLALKPDVIHCHDLDTVAPALCYSILTRIPWLYDAHECYPEQIGPQVHRFIYFSLLRLERALSRRADWVITVGERLARRFESFGARVAVVGNYPSLEGRRWRVPFPGVAPQGDARAHFESVGQLKAELRIPSGHIVVAYIGGFTPARAILPLIRATSLSRGFTVLLAGDGPQRGAIESEISSHPRVRYLGWLPHDRVEEYVRASDVIYYGLDGNAGNSYYSAPNMLFMAMAAGKPVITTSVGEIADIVKARQCGIVIPGAEPGWIARAVEELVPPATRLQAGENGRRAAESRYNWARAEKELLAVYNRLMTMKGRAG